MLRRSKSDTAFFATATRVVNQLENELLRAGSLARAGWRALELGCGSGRLLPPLQRHFLELHGVEVAEDLLAQARENVQDVARVQLHTSTTQLASSAFDFLYSHDFFPHLENRAMAMEFLREAHRVLRVGGLARIELSGNAFTSQDVIGFVQAHHFQLLALEGAATPSLWITLRRQPEGWQDTADASGRAAIRRVTNASSFEPVAPCRGRFASIILRVESLPLDAGIQHVRVMIGDSWGAVTYIGAPDRNGWVPLHVDLPELEATGLLPVQLHWHDRPLSDPESLRVIPPGPLVPRIVFGPGLTTGREANLTLEDIARPWEIEVSVSGRPVEDLERACTDPRAQCYTIRFRVPVEVAAGQHEVRVTTGRRKLAVTMEVT